MVFIDPVATGFSAPETGSTQDQFFGAYNDAESVATFIRTYTDTYKREDSPIYVMGKSYGGIRGSLVAQILQLPLYLPLKGVIFVSPCLSNTITDFSVNDIDVPYWTFFPTFATTSWYQKTPGREVPRDGRRVGVSGRASLSRRAAWRMRSAMGNALPGRRAPCGRAGNVGVHRNSAGANRGQASSPERHRLFRNGARVQARDRRTLRHPFCRRETHHAKRLDRQ